MARLGELHGLRVALQFVHEQQLGRVRQRIGPAGAVEVVEQLAAARGELAFVEFNQIQANAGAGGSQLGVAGHASFGAAEQAPAMQQRGEGGIECAIRLAGDFHGLLEDTVQFL